MEAITFSEGFYKLDNGVWFYAPNNVYSKDYTLDKNGFRGPIDGWTWHDTPPLEYTIWVLLQNQTNN
jgi:hypothetical protein